MVFSRIIALAGNPNVGKSTVFNYLTGMKQHTGNWPGKTVANAQGMHRHLGNDYVFVDLPGTYSLMANSTEEEIARDFICSNQADAVVVVCDATCLERNLYLVLQILSFTPWVVVCVNLLDEAKKKQININIPELSRLLGVPVVGTSARSGKGMKELMDTLHNLIIQKYEFTKKQLIAENKIIINDNEANKDNDQDQSLEKQKLINCVSFLDQENNTDAQVNLLVKKAESIAKEAIVFMDIHYDNKDRKLDRLFTGRITGIPIMLIMLAIIFWLTITGANYPSELLSKILFSLEEPLYQIFSWLGLGTTIIEMLIFGMYRTLAWVISVMLPPMAIFFPLFTILEDSGYLPRVAFNLDHFFKKSSACGKQALTMCMGFGCNAAGVIGCRIIDSPRERLIAILTNNFVPCNGRFPQPHKEQQNYSFLLTH